MYSSTHFKEANYEFVKNDFPISVLTISRDFRLENTTMSELLTSKLDNRMTSSLSAVPLTQLLI